MELKNDKPQLTENMLFITTNTDIQTLVDVENCEKEIEYDLLCISELGVTIKISKEDSNTNTEDGETMFIPQHNIAAISV